MYGGRGRRFRNHSAPLLDRLNTRCQLLFGETVEENYHSPAKTASNELLGLEYLFSQSSGEPTAFMTANLQEEGPWGEG